MVARFPESDAIIPVLIFKSLANQEAEDPESAERMQFSGSLFDNSQKTRCGFRGYAAFIARASNIFHHRSFSLMTRFCHSLFSFRFNKGRSDCKVFLLSPCRLTSVGYLIPSIFPSISICTALACPSFGRNSEYGKLEPIMKNVSHSIMRS